MATIENMEIKEAFEILGISEYSSKEEILNRYKSLVKEQHPDKGGSNEEMSRLNAAKDLVISFVDNQGVVKIVAGLSEIVKSNSEAISKRQEYVSQTNSIYSRITRHQTNKYKSIKNFTKLIGVFSGTLTLFSSKVIPILPKLFGDKGNTYETASFGLLAVSMGIFYLMLNYMTERIKEEIDDLKDFLNDKASYLDLINSLLYGKQILSGFLTNSDFEKLVHEWMHQDQFQMLEKIELDALINKSTTERIARRIGERDFARLIISKGLENGILKEKEVIKDGMPAIVYSVGNND